MFQFPPNPAVGQIFTPKTGINFRWNGTAWFLLGGDPNALLDLITSVADERGIMWAVSLG